MISRILALLTLSVLFAGCTPVAQAPAEPAVAPPEAKPVEAASVEVVPDLVIAEAPVPEQQTLASEPTGEQVVESAFPGAPAPDLPAAEPAPEPEPPFTTQLSAHTEAQQKSVDVLCNEIGNKLGSVSVDDCLAQHLHFAGSYTVQGRPMVVSDILPDDTQKKSPRVFIMGGIHGDEYSSISIMFKWMAMLGNSSNRDFHWRFAPTVNPDGLLDGQAVRQNANGVDLNRNFPSEDWLDLADQYWTNTTNRNPRRYPGSQPASEPEVQWIVEQIEQFRPNVIVSVHAPYHLLDYDGPPEAPQQIGELHLHLLGVYPGSLGNYAGINLGIPVVTMELPSAGIMPTEEQIVSMWNDLLAWLYEHLDT